MTRDPRRHPDETPRSAAGAAIALAIMACGCAAPDTETSWIVVAAAPGVDLSIARLHMEPPVAQRIERVGPRVALLVPHSLERMRLSTDDSCAVDVHPRERPASASQEVTLSPWLTFDGPIAQAGFGATVTVEARDGCEAASSAHVEWSISRGKSEHALRASPDGRRVEVDLPNAPPARSSVGIVPISANARGEVLLEARYPGRTGNPLRHVVSVSAAARATGLPSVSVDQRLLLGGSGWHLTSRPPGSNADVSTESSGAWFHPDAAGTYALEDSQGRSLSLSAGRIDRMPLDCTRSGCHEALGNPSPTPMATILERGLRGALGPEYEPGCALGCHATGEPGLEDGGFVAALSDAAEHLPRGEHAWEELPRSLRRLGGVGCLACHGPAAVPEPSARWAVLRSDVCAVCHDLPPEYGHVAAWRRGAMSRSDADPATRDDACARCHTTSGFLASTGALESSRRAPPEAGTIGIACAACHAVHGHSSTEVPRPGLLRDVPLPRWLADAPTVALASPNTRLCVSCHGPDPERLDAAASASALWAGRGGLHPETQAALEGPAPHGGIDGGCIGCHTGGSTPVRRGASHDFSVDRAQCARCHAARSPDAALRERALGLLAEAEKTTSKRERPPHARAADAAPKDPRGRALYDLRLVVEDPAAAIHNAPYARQLVDVAEQWLKSSVDVGGEP